MRSRKPTNDPDVYTSARSAFQQADHGSIANFRVVDQKLVLGSLQERCQTLARVDRANDKAIVLRSIWLTLSVGLKKFYSFLNQATVSRDNSEATTVINVEVSKVKPKNVEFFPINDHYLSVISDQ